MHRAAFVHDVQSVRLLATMPPLTPSLDLCLNLEALSKSPSWDMKFMTPSTPSLARVVSAL